MNPLREYIMEIVKASPEYMRKEKVREELQTLIAARVADGSISSQEELDDMFKTIGMATSALKMVPFKVYQGMSSKKS